MYECCVSQFINMIWYCYICFHHFVRHKVHHGSLCNVIDTQYMGYTWFDNYQHQSLCCVIDNQIIYVKLINIGEVRAHSVDFKRLTLLNAFIMFIFFFVFDKFAFLNSLLKKVLLLEISHACMFQLPTVTHDKTHIKVQTLTFYWAWLEMIFRSNLPLCIFISSSFHSNDGHNVQSQESTVFTYIHLDLNANLIWSG